MQFAPALPPLVITALALAGVISILISLRRRDGALPPLRRAAVCGLRFIVIALLIVILANPVTRREVEVRNRPGAVAVLSDTSGSMELGTPPRRDLLPAWHAPLRQQSATPVRFYSFADRARPEADPVSSAIAGDSAASRGRDTRIGQAILDVLDAESTELRDLVILSDGRAHDPDSISKALTLCRNRGIRISAATLGGTAPLTNLTIQRCDAPVAAASRSQVPVTLAIQALLPPQAADLILPVTITDAAGTVRANQEVRLGPGRTLATLQLTMAEKDEVFTVRIPPQPDEISLTDNDYTFSVANADRRLRILYMEGSNHTTYTPAGSIHEAQFLPLAWLQTGDMEVDLLVNDEQLREGGNLYKVKGFTRDNEVVFDTASGFPDTRAGVFAYDIIVCSDINRSLFSEQQLQWVVDLVTEQGGGFVMIGGNTAFDTGEWDQTIWERLVPVDMREYGRGHRIGTVHPKFSDAAVLHPILQFTPNEAINRAILRIHPPFLGSHLIEREKPGATVLAATANGQPLIAVQQYGKGRAMAFLSDAAGGWGERYQLSWGPRYLPADIRRQAESLGITLADSPGTTQSRIGNLFYNQFWVNTVRWLGEHSRTRSLSPLQLETDRAAASPGEKITVTATLAADPKDMPGELTATFADGFSFVLKPTVNADQFSAAITLPPAIAASEQILKVETTLAGRPVAARTPIRIDRYDREFSAPSPDPALMQRLAGSTNGVYLTTPGDLEAVIKGVDPGQLAALSVTIPAWNRLWLWCTILAAFSLAWLIPKLK